MNNFVIGDKVKVSAFYQSNYCGIASWKDQEAEVVKFVKRNVSVDSIEKSDRAMYTRMYGTLTHYDIFGLLIKFPNDNKLYMVSPFGVMK